MARLAWAAFGNRFFEAGVDRGVLYVAGQSGVAWSGLTGVSEAPAGATTKPYYIDGVKYLNRTTRDEYEATITAYTYPDEFEQCDGSASVGNGLFARNQRRTPFGFSYRTKLGNDIDGEDHAYKIHIVYDALAEPTTRRHQTHSDSQALIEFMWKVSTKQSVVRGFAPTSYFVIDSRETPGWLLQYIEDILYGTAQAAPRLPSAGELVTIFTTLVSHNYDAGQPLDISYFFYDAGGPTSVNTDTLDGGTP